MKQITNSTEVISEDQVPQKRAIFVKRENRLIGLVTKDDEGWIVSIGADYGAYGSFRTREACLNAGWQRGYTFHVEDEL